MADLLPSSPDPSVEDGGEPRVIGVDSDDADDLLSALSSGTARSLLGALHEEPTTPARLAETVDTSLQNAQYHLGKLRDAELIEVVDTVYSEKGREMSVYAPTDRPLVVFAGKEEETTGLKAALSRILGALGVLGLLSVAIQYVFGDGLGLGSGSAITGAGPATPAATSGSGGGVSSMSVETTTAAAAQSHAAAGLPPGLLFFAGGVVVVALAAVWWYAQARRRRVTG